MTNSIFILTITFSTPYSEGTVSGNTILFFLILAILIFSAAFFFGTRIFKKKMALNREILNGKIAFLKAQLESFVKRQNAQSAELNYVKERLEEAEKKWNLWIAEKKNLENEIEYLKDRMKNFRKNDDILIEYYMNENSGDWKDIFNLLPYSSVKEYFSPL